ncbi:MAG: hypothetical protein WDZ49_17320 [Litorilinea sp.]
MASPPETQTKSKAKSQAQSRGTAQPQSPVAPTRVRDTPEGTPLTMRRVAQTWWPLAAGWFLMTVEIPLISAVVARTVDPEINLATWGVIFSIALILASPVMMLLSASTAFCRDWPSYIKIRRYTWIITGGLTALHALIAFTPLYYFIAETLLATPAELVEPARIGLIIMLPYVPSLAYRRFNYGVLIRFGHSSAVTFGAMTRLGLDVITISIIFLLGGMPGAFLAATTFTLSVCGEAIYSGLRLRPVLRDELRQAPPNREQITARSFGAFFMPLVMTSMLQILIQPLGTAALSRMPDPILSLAVWPVVYGLIIMWTSSGMAFTEAVVVLLDQPRSTAILHNFTVRLGALMIGLLLIMNATPLTDIWFQTVAALPPDLAQIAGWVLWLALLLPGLSFLQSWYTGALVTERHTRGITEAMLVSLLVHAGILGFGIVWQEIPGLYIGSIALVAGHLTRTLWLWYRTRPAMRHLRARDDRLYPIGSPTSQQ